MAGYTMDVQRVYDTVSDAVLLDLVRRYRGFQHFARVLEDFAEVNRTLTAAGTHPCQHLTVLPEPLRTHHAKPWHDGVELEREFQAAVDEIRPDWAERLDAMRRQWAIDLARFIHEARTSNLPAETQALLQQALMSFGLAHRAHD
ncbi:MAG: hypothetical protein ACREPL_03670 [Rhodanobacteraceae bacterium]